MKKLLAIGVVGVLTAGLALAVFATADDGMGDLRSGGNEPQALVGRYLRRVAA